jgi:hypothetical protein
MKRTEDQIIRKAPVEITLGEVKYSLKVLGINKAMAWRDSLTKAMSAIVSGFGQEAGAAALSGGLVNALLDFPEKIVSLVFEYSPEVLGPDREKIMEDATEEQFSVAFAAIMEVAYPFLAQLGTVTSALRAAGISQP